MKIKKRYSYPKELESQMYATGAVDIHSPPPPKDTPTFLQKEQQFKTATAQTVTKGTTPTGGGDPIVDPVYEPPTGGGDTPTGGGDMDIDPNGGGDAYGDLPNDADTKGGTTSTSEININTGYPDPTYTGGGFPSNGGGNGGGSNAPVLPKKPTWLPYILMAVGLYFVIAKPLK